MLMLTGRCPTLWVFSSVEQCTVERFVRRVLAALRICRCGVVFEELKRSQTTLASVLRAGQRSLENRARGADQAPWLGELSFFPSRLAERLADSLIVFES